MCKAWRRSKGAFCYRTARIFIVLLISDLLFTSTTVLSQQNNCKTNTPDTSVIIRSVRVTGRWVPDELKKKVAVVVGVGQTFRSSRISSAIKLVSDEIPRFEDYFPIRLAGSVAVSLTTVNYCVNKEHPEEVDIVIIPNYLHIDLFNLGNNILPVPRSAGASFYKNVPASLMAISPVISLNYDRRYGSSLAIQTITDLLHLPLSNMEKNPKLRLDLALEGRKSFTNPFHTLAGRLELNHPVYNHLSNGWNVGVDYTQKKQPLAKGSYKQELVKIYGAFEGVFKKGFIKKYALGGATTFQQNQYMLTPQIKLENPENGYEIFVLSDGQLGRTGFNRLGIWYDAGIPEGLQSYKRIAVQFAYAKSFISKKSTHNSFDLEFNAGNGYSWGLLPAYKQFFAGNTAQNFLYEPFASSIARTMPQGPLIRSLGQNEGSFQTANGFSGGSSSWNINLNFSFPVAKWSRPLIPDIVVAESGLPLQTQIKNLAIGFGRESINEDLVKNQGMADDSATTVKAEAIVKKELEPMITYVTDRANILSIKPLLLFDLAQLHQSGLQNKTWTAAGAGIQLSVVIARLEIGYMHTISPKSDSKKGNFFLRFVFQNFF